MIRANEGQGTLLMTDEEIAGNTFLLLVAGHESTARALDATNGFLALYEDIQEEVYNEIQDVVADNGKLISASRDSELGSRWKKKEGFQGPSPSHKGSIVFIGSLPSLLSVPMKRH